jgi:hypothetical protein
MQSARRFIDSIPVLRDAQSLFATMLRRRRSSQSACPTSIAEPPTLVQATSNLAQFHDALSEVGLRSVLRERLARGSGNECYEFLIAVRSFEEAVNPLQRYQVLSDLMHRFVSRGAERLVPLSRMCRADLQREWSEWAGKGRVPSRLNLAAVAAAAIEINTLLVVGLAQDADSEFLSTIATQVEPEHHPEHP